MNMITAAKMWNAGAGSKAIAQALGIREAEVYNKLDLVRFTAEMMKNE